MNALHNLKIAIVCDWLVTLGGAEKVLREILTCFPHAQLFAVVDYLSDDDRKQLFHKKARTSFIQQLPFSKSHYRSYLPLMPLAIEQLDCSHYDLILSSSHAVAKGILTGPDQIHISYVHSPMRYAWDLQNQYLSVTGLDKKWRGTIARYCLHRLRLWDMLSTQRVDHLLANSQYIAQRIQKTYRRPATVIYPPVDIDRFTPTTDKADYYLTASRLVPYKRIDLIVESFQYLKNKKLIVIGAGPEFNRIQAKAGRNVMMLGYQSDKQLLHYLQRAKAFLFAAEEDFGILPLEAQAAGTPVIAYGKGGACETIRSIEHTQPTGLFFKEQTVTALCEAIEQFETMQTQFTTEHCRANAERFHPTQFRKQFMQTITTLVSQTRV